MLGLMVTGRLHAWMARAEAAAGGASAGASAQD
jgi:hypothetical protein